MRKEPERSAGVAWPEEARAPSLAGLARQPATLGALALALLILCVFFGQLFLKAYRPQGYDLTSYLLSARALLHGADPYRTDTVFPYSYPLFLAFALIPLALLPYGLACALWFWLNVAALAGVLAYLGRALPERFELRPPPAPVVPLVAAGLVFWQPIQNDLLNGQVNLVVLAACVGFFAAYQMGRSRLVPLLLSIAIAIKLVPVLLVLFLVWRRRAWALAWTAGLTTALCLIPGLALLGRGTFAITDRYIHEFILRGFASQLGDRGGLTFSLAGVVRRLVPGLPATPLVTASCGLLVLAWLTAIELRLRRRPSAEGEIWAFCAYLLAILLISPASEKHHLVLALPAGALVLLGLLTSPPRTRPLAWIAYAGVATGLWVGGLTPHGPWCFIAVTLLAALVSAQFREPRSPEPPTPGTRVASQ